jgi:hypothetical protein
LVGSYEISNVTDETIFDPGLREMVSGISSPTLNGSGDVWVLEGVNERVVDGAALLLVCCWILTI